MAAAAERALAGGALPAASSLANGQLTILITRATDSTGPTLAARVPRGPHAAPQPVSLSQAVPQPWLWHGSPWQQRGFPVGGVCARWQPGHKAVPGAGIFGVTLGGTGGEEAGQGMYPGGLWPSIPHRVQFLGASWL